MWNDLHFKPYEGVRGEGACGMTSTLSPMNRSVVSVHVERKGCMYSDLNFKPCKRVMGEDTREVTSTLSPMNGSWVRIHVK